MQDNFDKYKGRLGEFHKEAKSNCWTAPLATFIYLALAILIATIILRVIYSFAGGLATILIFVVEAAALLGAIFYYDKQVKEYMSSQCLDLEPANPGISDAWDEWKERTRKALPDGGSF